MDRVNIYIKQFEYYKKLAEMAIDQLESNQLFKEVANGTNSIAVIMKHIAGNLISRWTNVFKEDGEKEWRNRDSEFVDDFNGKDELLAYWNKGWKILFDLLNTIDEADLERIIYIRNMGCSLDDAILRQLCHYPYHIGQIVFVSKYFKGESFSSLTIPLGASKTYNKEKFDQEKSIKHFTDDNDLGDK